MRHTRPALKVGSRGARGTPIYFSGTYIREPTFENSGPAARRTRPRQEPNPQNQISISSKKPERLGHHSGGNFWRQFLFCFR